MHVKVGGGTLGTGDSDRWCRIREGWEGRNDGELGTVTMVRMGRMARMVLFASLTSIPVVVFVFFLLDSEFPARAG